MKSRCAAILPGLLGIFGVLPAKAALPAEPSAEPSAEVGCAHEDVDVAAEVRHRWPDLPAAIQLAFADRTDIDPCARVTLTLRGNATLVQVALTDGRVAERSVSRPEDLIPTLEALLLLPLSQPHDQPPSHEAPAPATVTANRAVVSFHDAGAIPPASPSSRVRIDLSAAMGARAGAGQAGIGIGILSFVEIAEWLAGIEGRVDGYQGISSATSTGALEIGVLGGRRFRAGTLALDLVAGPTVAIQGGSKSVRPVGSTDPGVTTSFFKAAPRLLGGAHLTFRANSTLRTFLGIEGEFGLSGVDAKGSSDVPPPPLWTAGLVAGITVGTR